MSLPSEVEYSLPPWTGAQRPPWELRASRALVLVHDLQQYFLKVYVESTEPLTPLLNGVAGLLPVARRAGVPVVWSAQDGNRPSAERGLLRDFWGAGIQRAPHEHQVHPRLKVLPSDLTLTKTRYSAFYQTALDGLMVDHQRDQLILCGVYAHIGVLATALDAFARNLQTFVVYDAVADFSRQHHQAAMEQVAGTCGAIVSVQQVINALEAG